MAVVVAKDPMPSVSKKFVTAPTAICVAVGRRASVAGDASAAGFRRIATTAADHPATNTAVSAPSAVCRAKIGLSTMLSSLQGSSGRRIIP